MLQFKDPSAQIAYIKKYGKQSSLFKTHVDSLNSAANGIEQMMMFGPSGKSNLDAVVDTVAETLRSRSGGTGPIAKQLDTLKTRGMGEGQSIDRFWGTATGEGREPGDPVQAAFVNGAMGLARLTQLGAATLSSIGDVVAVAAQYVYGGTNPFMSILRTVVEPIQALPGSERATFMRQTGAGIDGYLNELGARADIEDGGGRGLINGAQTWLFKLSLLEQWTDINRGAYTTGLASEMAHHSATEFDKLPANVQRHLQDYNIDAREWDSIRSHSVVDVGETKMSAADKVREIPDEEIREMLVAKGKKPTPTNIKRHRQDLESRYRSFYVDGANFAVLEGDPRVAAAINASAGTIPGDAYRLSTQYLGMPIAFSTQVLGRHLRGFDAAANNTVNPSAFRGARTPGGFATVAALAGSMTAMGMVNIYLRAKLNGMDIDFNDPDKRQGLILAAAAKGGGLGILSDLAFRLMPDDANYASPLLGDFGGPVVGMLGDGNDLVQGIFSGDFLKAVKSGRRLTPFQNLWWLKPILDYGFMYGLQEAIQPGVLQRIEASAKRRGTPYYAPPSEYANQL